MRQEETTYREIPLTKGYVALVDECDYARISQYKWHVNNSHGTPYAYRRHYTDSVNSFMVAMHREIMGLERGDRMQVDHVNPSETLDNRRSNLRVATPIQNARNKRISPTNTSGLKGVSFHKGRKKWAAYISIKNKTKYLGLFGTAEEAHLAYAQAAKSIFGEFARME